MPGAKRNQARGQQVRKLRPLPKDLNKCLEHLGQSFNFGLYFNKWLFAEWNTTKKGFKYLDYDFRAKGQARTVLEKYRNYQIFNLLDKRHNEFNNICKSFQKIGYQKEERFCILQTPLIIGLGNAHPTERGFTFHWTLGIPYLPAESIKGVVRLAYLINRAEEDPDFFEHWAEENEKFWEYLAEPFGRAEKDGKRARRGKVIFLDALPVETPKLTLEITTCHYPKYYEGKRGPTEDQNPNPLPFLAVAPGAKFHFVLLMHESLGDKAKEKLLKAFHAALAEHGFGAKTALGHGRFVYGS